MGKIKELEEKVSQVYNDLVYVTDKKEFYEGEAQRLEQELRRLEMALGDKSV